MPGSVSGANLPRNHQQRSEAIDEICALLESHEVVEPQDYLDPMPWWGGIEAGRKRSRNVPRGISRHGVLLIGTRDQIERERHVARGKLLPRERVDRLLDPGTAFLELNALAAWELYDGAAPGAGPDTSGKAFVDLPEEDYRMIL